jgi:hypothetical protein
VEQSCIELPKDQKEVIMMEATMLRDKVVEEIKLLPDHKLMEILDLVHYFRVGWQGAEGDVTQIMGLAGSWKDMPEDTFREFSAEIVQRRLSGRAAR